MNRFTAIGILVASLAGALGAVPPKRVCTGWMEMHGYGFYIHAEDAAKAQKLHIKLDPDWSPHIMDDPGASGIPDDWCDRMKNALSRPQPHGLALGQQK